jgi:hypothetical protein
MPDRPAEEDGQLHTLGLLERLRAECCGYWDRSFDLHTRIQGLLRELANPNLHDINPNLGYHIELWDEPGLRVRWVVAAIDTIAVAHAAFEAAAANWPGYNFKLRKGALVIREHPETARE